MINPALPTDEISNQIIKELIDLKNSLVIKII